MEHQININEGPRTQEHNTFDIDNRKEDSTYYSLQKMNQLHHEIVRRLVVGQKDHEIAKSLGISAMTVKYTKESPIVQQKMDILMGARDASAIEVRKHIKHLAPLALDEMQRLLVKDGTADNTRVKVAQDILDRAGYGAVKVSAELKGKLTKEDIQEAKQRAINNGLIKEVEVIEDAEEVEEETEQELNEE